MPPPIQPIELRGSLVLAPLLCFFLCPNHLRGLVAFMCAIIHVMRIHTRTHPETTCTKKRNVIRQLPGTLQPSKPVPCRNSWQMAMPGGSVNKGLCA